MSDARIVICETTGDWAAALGQWFPAIRPHMLETRSVADVLATFGVCSPSVLFVELLDRRGACRLELLSAASVAAPEARLVVALTTPGASADGADQAKLIDELAAAAREAGALAVLRSPIELAALAPMVEYVLALPAPRPRRLRELLWARLPWSEQTARFAPPAAL